MTVHQAKKAIHATDRNLYICATAPAALTESEHSDFFLAGSNVTVTVCEINIPCSIDITIIGDMSGKKG